MKRMFGEATRAFYNSALPMPLGKPPPEGSRAFLKSRFAEAGLVIADVEVESILTTSCNVPYYL